ncbi:MAG: hypothetical protein L3J50_08645 [Emcibacter sp.]|nr:hypothetical protein [Emcibacter sp.]
MSIDEWVEGFSPMVCDIKVIPSKLIPESMRVQRYLISIVLYKNNEGKSKNAEPIS